MGLQCSLRAFIFLGGHAPRLVSITIKTLVQFKIDTRIASIIITFTQNEVTPLMSACLYGCTATARVLLEHGANVDLCAKVRDFNMHTHFE